MYFLIVLFLIGLIYVVRKRIQSFIEHIIRIFTNISMPFTGKILPTLIKVVILNWYIYLMLLLLWGLLFFTNVGSDIINAYLNNLKQFSFPLRFGSFISVFFSLFFMSLAIWILPFFLYSAETEKTIHEDTDSYYLYTKMLAFVAMFPFLIVTNAFLAYADPFPKLGKWNLLVINSVSLLIFLGLAYLFKKNKKLKLPGFITSIADKLKEKIPNPYYFIVFGILFWVILLSLGFAIFRYEVKTMALLGALFIFLTSIIVFRLLFYTDETGIDDTRVIVDQMLSKKNKDDSKKLYLWLIWLLVGVTFYYYIVPSLESTNPLYILLIVFGFFVMYLDLWRHLFRNRKGILRIVAVVGTLLFLALPFISRHDQFRIPLSKSAIEQEKRIPLKQALEQRIAFINEKNHDTGSIYIICAMGGGSRAGYITAAVLRKLDSLYPRLWDQTVCYSTISGGSVGAYNFLIGKEKGLVKDSFFLPYIYQKNYNSSGVYGLLVGDAIETFLGGFATIPKSWVARDPGALGFFDRNYRIREEYDFVLNQALLIDTTQGYLKKTFCVLNRNPPESDFFQDYFFRHGNTVPIHFVNTFEINSGRRTVISPFAASKDSLFLNALLPLQDTAFDDCILKKDIRYREAVNLSELFPIVSAASHIGTKSNFQFVDGGYYENYGLATGLDIYNYLRRTLRVDSARLKIILIKNSKQEVEAPGEQVQLLAPLIGAINSPFTGHANDLLEQTKRIADSTHFYPIIFDADAKKVPLTRALTLNHIDSMNSWVNTLPVDTPLLRFIGKLP